MNRWTVYNHTNDAVYRVSAENEDNACKKALEAGCLDVAGAVRRAEDLRVEDTDIVLPPLLEATARDKAWVARGLLIGMLLGLLSGIVIGGVLVMVLEKL